MKGTKGEYCSCPRIPGVVSPLGWSLSGAGLGLMAVL
jgi:hypothetical protein